ncbi:hypothetical protein BC831DRAFT_449274 [Entophlyctis helioformis]|nr:hypothetical protein BC831DRAFT_449274 [Entophlyctis helioformis]
MFESADSLFGTVMSGVRERALDLDADMPVPVQSNTNAHGFPVPVHRSQWKPSRANRLAAAEPAARPKAVAPSGQDAVKQGISDENDRAIAGMSADEIEEMRREIMSKLDPSALAFLQRRHEQRRQEQQTGADAVADVVESASHGLEQVEQVHDTEMDAKVDAGGFAHIDEYIDPATAEPQKLAWMQELEMVQEEQRQPPPTDDLPELVPEKSRLRFDFKGAVMDEQAGTQHESHSGLFHHGADPSLAGYSIEELVHLSKSTVPTQRALSLQTLARILASLHTEQYPVEQRREIRRFCRSTNVLLHIRVALDASHETVVIRGLEALVEVLGASSDMGPAITPSDSSRPVAAVADREWLWDRLALGRAGYRAVPLAAESLSLFAAKSAGKDTAAIEMPDNNGSLASILSLMNKDTVLGLLSTNILVRLRYLVDNLKLPLASHMDVIRVLTAIAHHSDSSAQDILECAGLVDAIARTAVAAKWPLPNTATPQLTLIRNALRLFRVLCQSGRDAAAALIRHHVIDVVVRFLTMPPSVVPSEPLEMAGLQLKLEIAMHVWTIQGVVFTYTLGGRLFDEYRTLVFDHAKSVCDVLSKVMGARSSGLEMREYSDALMCTAFGTLAAVCRTLTTLLVRYRADMNAGGENDAMQSYAGLMAGLLVTVNNNSLGRDAASLPEHMDAVFVSAALDFLHTYVSQSLTFQYEPMPHTMATLRTVAGPLSTLAARFTTVGLASALETGLAGAHATSGAAEFAPGEDYHWSTPLCSTSRRVLASRLGDAGAIGHALSSMLEMDQTARRHLAREMSAGGALAVDPACVGFVRHLATRVPLTSYARHGDWVRVFGQGKPALLLVWTRSTSLLLARHASSAAATLAAPVVPEETLATLGPLMALVGTVGLPELVPGDEYLAAEWLNGYLLSAKSKPLPSIDAALSQVFALDAFATSPLQQSQALYRSDDAVRLNSLFFEAAVGAGSLPLRRDWMFGPLDRLYREMRAHGLTSIPDDMAGIVRHVLGLVHALSSAGCLSPASIPPSVKLLHMMRVFLLSDGSGTELFRLDGIASVLDWAFDTFTAEIMAAGHGGLVASAFETGAGGGTSFYQLYEDLIQQFAGVSFAALHFQKYLVVPLAMTFPRDYRSAFWTMLNDVRLLRAVRLTAGDLEAAMGGRESVMGVFGGQQETDQDLLRLYRSVRGTLGEGSLLADIVDVQLARR